MKRVGPNRNGGFSGDIFHPGIGTAKRGEHTHSVYMADAQKGGPIQSLYMGQ